MLFPAATVHVRAPVAFHAATLPKISTLLTMSLTMLPLPVDAVSKPEMVMPELLANDVSARTVLY